MFVVLVNLVRTMISSTASLATLPTNSSSFGPPVSHSRSRTLSSSSSSPLPPQPKQGDVLPEESLPHVNVKLDSKQYETPAFAHKLLTVVRALRIPSWLDSTIRADTISLHKVSGSLTNAVYFVSYPPLPHTRTLLLRLYGPGTESFIFRPRELHILHVLSSRYGFGPRVYGTLENGRVEEYFESHTLTTTDIRNPQISRWIAARMVELHSVDVHVVEGTFSHRDRSIRDKAWDMGVTRNVHSWIKLAREVVALEGFPAASSGKHVDLDLFATEWKQYLRWLASTEKVEPPSPRVFAHNDAQCGNLLRLTERKQGAPEHHQIVVVDFEYASANPAAFDIANHFIEWTTDYNSSTPEVSNPTLYPSYQQRREFYVAYLKQTSQPAGSGRVKEGDVQILERQVEMWTPASHAMWAVWGLVQAREAVENHDTRPDFDYIEYALGRMDAFRRGIKQLGIS